MIQEILKGFTHFGGVIILYAGLSQVMHVVRLREGPALNSNERVYSFQSGVPYNMYASPSQTTWSDSIWNLSAWDSNTDHSTNIHTLKVI